MVNQTDKSKVWRVIPFVVIMVAMMVTGGIALAGRPAGAPASVKASPPAQGKSNTTGQRASPPLAARVPQQARPNLPHLPPPT